MAVPNSVTLSGLGGDELFAGYPSFRRVRQLKRLAAIPAPVRSVVARIGKALMGGSVQHTQKRVGAAGRRRESLNVYRTSRQLFAPEEISVLMTDRRSAAPCSLLLALSSCPFLELSAVIFTP